MPNIFTTTNVIFYVIYIGDNIHPNKRRQAMKQIFAAILIVMVIGGLVAALAVLSSGEPSDNQAAANTPAAPAESPEPKADDQEKTITKVNPAARERDYSVVIDNLARRLKALELKNKALESKIEKLAARSETTGVAEGDDSSVASGPITPDLEKDIATIVDKQFEERDQARREERTERRKKFFSGMLDKLAEHYEWDEATAGEVKKLLADKMQQLRKLRDESRKDGASREDAREEMRRFAEETKKELEDLVGEEAAKKLGHFLGGGRGGGRGGPPRGGGKPGK
jgi:flagellar basal body-associated protein FliL